jgi:hypothetical protein
MSSYNWGYNPLTNWDELPSMYLYVCSFYKIITLHGVHNIIVLYPAESLWSLQMVSKFAPVGDP